MHLSKGVLYVGIIAYSAALLVLQDWGLMLATTGTVSLLWLCKMGVDILFAGMAGIRLVGPALFADDEGDDEVAIHAEDLAFSDTALYGFFIVNVIGNLSWHGYVTVMSTGGLSFYYSLWTIAEAVVLFFTYILWSHAVKVQRRLAKRSKQQSTTLRDVA